VIVPPFSLAVPAITGVVSPFGDVGCVTTGAVGATVSIENVSVSSVSAFCELFARSSAPDTCA